MIMLESGTVVSGLLGMTIKLTINLPSSVGTALTVINCILVALLAKVPATTQNLTNVSNKLLKYFKGLALANDVPWKEDPGMETTKS